MLSEYAHTLAIISYISLTTPTSAMLTTSVIQNGSGTHTLIQIIEIGSFFWPCKNLSSKAKLIYEFCSLSRTKDFNSFDSQIDKIYRGNYFCNTR